MKHFYQNIGEDWFTYPSFYKEMVERFDNCNFLEIGSWKGRSSSYLAVEIINQKKNIKVFCVDSWTPYNDIIEIKEKGQWDDIYNEFLRNIEPVKAVITPIRKTSQEAVLEFPESFFNFVFIDAEHSYEAVRRDIDLWFPKLKKGGVLAGHDYNSTWTGVTKAVNNFVKERGLSLFKKGEELIWALKK